MVCLRIERRKAPVLQVVFKKIRIRNVMKIFRRNYAPLLAHEICKLAANQINKSNHYNWVFCILHFQEINCSKDNFGCLFSFVAHNDANELNWIKVNLQPLRYLKWQSKTIDESGKGQFPVSAGLYCHVFYIKLHRCCLPCDFLVWFLVIDQITIR